MTTNNTEDNNKQAPAPGVQLHLQLRRTMPLRKLAYYEHLIIAERQATQLHGLLKQQKPGVSLEWLSNGSLGNIEVVLVPRWRLETTAWAASGFSKWRDGHWIIGVNKGQPQARRRFTLCHELKHVLDAHRDKITYANISADQRERIADYFAACYLMPKRWLRHEWTTGLQDADALAGLFKVSLAAMQKRLTYLQYLDDEPDREVTTYFRNQPDWVTRRSDMGTAA